MHQTLWKQFSLAVAHRIFWNHQIHQLLLFLRNIKRKVKGRFQISSLGVWGTMLYFPVLLWAISSKGLINADHYYLNWEHISWFCCLCLFMDNNYLLSCLAYLSSFSFTLSHYSHAQDNSLMICVCAFIFSPC